MDGTHLPQALDAADAAQVVLVGRAPRVGCHSERGGRHSRAAAARQEQGRPPQVWHSLRCPHWMSGAGSVLPPCASALKPCQSTVHTPARIPEIQRESHPLTAVHAAMRTAGLACMQAGRRATAHTCRNQDWALRSAGGTADRRRDTPSAARPCRSPVSAAFFLAFAPCMPPAHHVRRADQIPSDEVCDGSRSCWSAPPRQFQRTGRVQLVNTARKHLVREGAQHGSPLSSSGGCPIHLQATCTVGWRPVALVIMLAAMAQMSAEHARSLLRHGRQPHPR
jgi:hypothetical protein